MQKPLIVRGTYGGNKRHCMLATLYTTNSNGKVTAVIANDPYSGLQVKIDPSSKQVMTQGFPLIGWTMDQYQPVLPPLPALP